ncbi:MULTISPECIES: 4-hydroxy-tetrahydrodipicolinate synthase [unclassified Janthinobacterium]|uniref:4-hydroxy-tetrahydrodipicolinate synthase n=1 Tax=unclassified Janthinobacterium TaxID=2610881 RepID=UPI000344D5E0|nr:MULTISPECIES: 4-hydroxy-tetrahydrodipicolinate synthase [unclassified Janthinobacterium]MEC5161737.1 4-hydroxy-tetrahydrodipicolinate synthase [Janthinobacterium sp. CG_S6]
MNHAHHGARQAPAMLNSCDNAMSSRRITAHFQGIWVPMVTPLRDGGVDYAAAAALAAQLASNGIHGLVVCGSTGEAATLSEAEQAALLRTVLDAVGPHFPVVMGVAGGDTRAVAARVQRYNDQPLAGLLISAPSSARPSQAGILRHFQAISALTDHSIILYNIPARTGVNIAPATVAELSLDTRFVAIKEAGGGMRQITELLATTRLDVLSGDDALLLATLCAGGHGAISAAAHIRPDLYAQLYELVKGGHAHAARELFKALLPMIRLLFAEPNPGPVKAALALQGRIGDELRLPMTPMTAAGRARLSNALEALMTLPRWPARGARADRRGDGPATPVPALSGAAVVPCGRRDDHRRH